MSRKEEAVTRKHNGYNCCQAVLCSFSEEAGLPEETLKKLGAGYCVGLGCMEATCGALCAAEMLLGLTAYQGRPILREAAALHRAFKERCGASICKDLKGIGTGSVLCECDDCVRNAVVLTEEFIEKQ